MIGLNEKIRESGLIIRQVFKEINPLIDTGVNLLEIDNKIGLLLKGLGARSGTRMQGFPGNVFLSVNKEVLGGLPRDYSLKEGDILTLDLTLYYNGLYVDKAITLGLEPLHYSTRYLLKAVSSCFEIALSILRDGVVSNRIGGVIESIAKRLRVVPGKDFYGHGIGFYAHQPPFIPNFFDDSSYTLRESDVITLEPIVFYEPYFLTYPNRYTITSNSLSAHKEETIIILKDGFEVIT